MLLSNLLLRLMPVLILLAYTVDSLLIEFVGACGNLRGKIEWLPTQQWSLRWIKDSIGEQFYAVIDEEPG